MNDKSKTIVCDDGELLNTKACREVLLAYWGLSIAEKRAFDRLFKRKDLIEEYNKNLTTLH